MEPLLCCAIEGRKRVKDQLCRIDQTMEEVEFTYRRVGRERPRGTGRTPSPCAPWRNSTIRNCTGRGRVAEGPEDRNAAATAVDATADAGGPDGFAAVPNGASTAAVPMGHGAGNATPSTVRPEAPARMTPIERLAAKADGKRKELLDNQRGVTYYRLFGPYLAGASRILVKDAYVRVPYQLRNFAEFLETALRCKDPDKDVVEVHLVTGRNDPEYRTAQMDGLETPNRRIRSTG